MGECQRCCRRQAARFSRIGLHTLLALLFAAIPPRMASAQASRDTLSIGITQYPATLNPDIEAMLAKSYVLGMAVRPLTTYDQAWKLVCLLCVTLPTIENGGAVVLDLPDGSKGVALTYEIRPDAFWGDGVPVTTDDITFTYEVGRNPQSGVNSAEMYRRITRVTAMDAKRFTLEVDKLTFDYAAIDDFVPLPAHLERAAFAEPAQYRTRTLYDTQPLNPGLYNGPYRIAAVSAGAQITLERNPFWKGKTPQFRQITVKTIENTAALEANLLSGSVDMVAGELGFPPDQAQALEKRQRDRYQFLYKPGLGYEHVDLNLGSPLLEDRRVRQALLLGLDRQAISAQLFGGQAPVADSFMSPLDAGHATDIPAYPHDPARAKALLEQAGWTAQGSGTRIDNAGNKLTVELMTTAGNRSRELVEQVMQSQWRQIGVETRLRNEPARIFFGETLRQRKFEAGLFAWISAPENVPRSTLHSSEIPSAANGFSGQNTTGFANPEMDRLIDAIETELDATKRQSLWAEMQRLYATELPALPLFFRSDAFVLPKWLGGIRPTGNQSPTTLWIEEWTATP